MTGADPRSIACDILNSLDTGKSTLDGLITEKFDPVFHAMDRRDRNFTYALIYGVLRTRGKLDWIIHRFSKSGIQKIDPPVLNILRCALFQIFFMDRTPPSAAVNTAVSLSKKTAPQWVVRFVNGLLRNIIRNQADITWPDKAADPLLWLSVEESFPLWMVSRWTERFGLEETCALCRFYNTIPPVTMRTNTLKVSRETLAASVIPFADTVAYTPYAPEGILATGLKARIQEMDAFAKGWFQVQDEAAQFVSHVVAPRPGETVMDACAGLGGKTGHMAQLMKNDGTITAMDSHTGRLEKLEIQMTRLGVSIVNVFHHDLHQGLDPKHHLLYDRVLIDAPCSGTGVIRRNPDTRWSVAPDDFIRYREKQRRYIDNVSACVRPGGTLVYAVCSIEPEETADVVSGFMKAHPEFTALPISGIPDSFPLAAGAAGGRLRILPHEHQMDGFFIAAFKKNE